MSNTCKSVCFSPLFAQAAKFSLTPARRPLPAFLIACLLALAACGGGPTSSSSSGGGSSATISISPTKPTVYFGYTQQFTANVTGISNPVVQWDASAVGGTISQSGLYTAPPPAVELSGTDTVYASVVGGPSASTTVNLLPAPAVLTSISPNAASAGEQVTVTTQYALNGNAQLMFSGVNGAVVSASIQTVSFTQFTALVPFGTVSGAVYLQYEPFPIPSPIQNSNSLSFTRLPNLRIHAPGKDLSSGETMQFSSSLLGANSPTQVDWSATTGTISASGLYQAPVVTSESTDHVTGCVQGTNSCDTVVLRILPLRITPDPPIVSLGGSIQLDADLGGSPQSAQWSVLAGGGAIANGSLYTAPSSGSGAGPVAVSASVGSASEQAWLSVTGAFPGLVNRLYEYLDVYDPAPNTEGFITDAVTAYGNRAYAVDFGGPANHALAPSYSALDVYDITNPAQPVWISAVESVSTNPIHVFAYGNNLFEVDSGILTPAPSRIVTYSLQGGQPVLSQITSLPDLAITTVNNGIVYGLPENQMDEVYGTSFPVYLCDVRSGTPIITQYTLPIPAAEPPLTFWSISGIGNTLYVSWGNMPPNDVPLPLTLATYDISTSPPTLVSYITTQFGFALQVVNSSLLFADAQVYDISNVTPVPLTTIPMFKTLSVQGNSVVALGFFSNYFVIDVSNPSNPVITRNVADLLTGYPGAVLAGNDLFTSEGFGGVGVYDVSARGGPTAWSAAGSLEGSFDQVLHALRVFPTVLRMREVQEITSGRSSR